MKGLDLCKCYFLEECEPVLEKEFGKGLKPMAIGLVGDGSECYGYDDEISRDHDWGPGFCIWLSIADYRNVGGRIQAVYDSLPNNYRGYERKYSQWGGGRTGVLEIGAFYEGFIGKYQPPRSMEEWLLLPENALAAATNGEVFLDSLGEFTEIRNRLLEFYPEDVRLKKIAARCMTIGREGQYNFPRCVKRKEYYAAQYAEIKFCADAMSMVFLLNRRYAPFYKWAHRAVKELPILGNVIHQDINRLIEEKDYQAKVEQIESISQVLIKELRQRKMSDHPSDYLPDHGSFIQQSIQDQGLRNRNVWIG